MSNPGFEDDDVFAVSDDEGMVLDRAAVEELCRDFMGEVVLTRAAQTAGTMTGQERAAALDHAARLAEARLYGLEEGWQGSSWFSPAGLGRSLAAVNAETEPDEQVVRVLLTTAVRLTDIYDQGYDRLDEDVYRAELEGCVQGVTGRFYPTPSEYLVTSVVPRAA